MNIKDYKEATVKLNQFHKDMRNLGMINEHKRIFRNISLCANEVVNALKSMQEAIVKSKPKPKF